MKKIAILLCTVLFVTHTGSLIAQPAKQLKQTTYTNPLPVAFGDPYVMHVKGDKYYMYGTGAGAKHGFSAYSSTDLVNWKNEGQFILETTKMAGAALTKPGTEHIGLLRCMK